MEIDMDRESLEQDFSVLNEAGRKNIIEMTRFLVFTQNIIVPGLLKENRLGDRSMQTQAVAKERRSSTGLSSLNSDSEVIRR
jgi:hypothetical protein